VDITVAFSFTRHYCSAGMQFERECLCAGDQDQRLSIQVRSLQPHSEQQDRIIVSAQNFTQTWTDGLWTGSRTGTFGHYGRNDDGSLVA
jgi:hypothetical protein